MLHIPTSITTYQKHTISANIVAIVKRETNSWKWPVLQLIIMTVFAYIVALIAFQFLK